MKNEDIIHKLNVIAAIEKGQTFSDAYDTPLDHNIWSTTLWRTYNREDRKKSVNCIKNILDQGYTLYNTTYDVSVIEALKLALIGLENLKVTYKGDHIILGFINTIIDDYKKKLVLNESDFFTNIKSKNYTFIENYLYEGNNPNVKNIDGQNALHLVCEQYYNAKIMDILLNFNIGLTDKDIYNNTPLYYAVTSGCTDAVLKLEEAISKKKRENL